MEYRGPQDSDYENVRALNRALLDLLAAGTAGDRWLAPLPGPLAERCRRLGVARRARLAGTPFLLLTFRETDTERWEGLLAAGRNRDLFASAPDARETPLLDATLGFAWQLARANAYAARLLCGASLHWCELVAEQPLVRVLAVAADAGLAGLRRADDPVLWQRLLTDCTAPDRTLCEAARIAALQRVLTSVPGLPLKRAARRLDGRTLRVADESGR